MNINTLFVLKNLEGEVLVFDGKPLTLRTVMITSLLGENEGDTGQDKVKKFQLASSINSMDEMDLTSESASMIKDMVAKAYATLVVGQVFEILDGK